MKEEGITRRLKLQAIQSPEKLQSSPEKMQLRRPCYCFCPTVFAASLLHARSRQKKEEESQLKQMEVRCWWSDGDGDRTAEEMKMMVMLGEDEKEEERQSRGRENKQGGMLC